MKEIESLKVAKPLLAPDVFGRCIAGIIVAVPSVVATDEKEAFKAMGNPNAGKDTAEMFAGVATDILAELYGEPPSPEQVAALAQYKAAIEAVYASLQPKQP